MKLKFKTKESTFGQLVAELVEVEKDLRRMSDPLESKLTAKAFVREAIRKAMQTDPQCTPERIAARRKQIEKPESFEGFELQATVRRMISAIRLPGWAAPPEASGRLNFCFSPAALAEVLAMGSSPYEIFAVAVMIAGERHPECFGRCDDSEDFKKRFEELTLRRAELQARIATEFSADDLIIAEGNAPVTFKLSQGKVPLAPKENAAERLVNFLISTEAKVSA